MSFGRNLRPMNAKEVKYFQEMVFNQFGTKFSTDRAFFIHEKEQDVYLMTRDIERIPYDNLRIDNLGLYVAQILARGHQVRLSIEGAQMLIDPAPHRVLTIPEAYKKSWLFGDDLNLGDIFSASFEEGWYIVRTSKDVLGCGLVKGNVLRNFVPKGRKISSKE